VKKRGVLHWVGSRARGIRGALGMIDGEDRDAVVAAVGGVDKPPRRGDRDLGPGIVAEKLDRAAFRRDIVICVGNFG
jgi:hypothetical protein